MKLFGLEINREKTLASAPVDPALDLVSTIRQQLLAGIESAAGANISDDSVLSLSAAFACMKVIAEDVAVTPLITYRRRGEARERATTHLLYDLLRDLPNPEMVAFTFKEMLTYQILLPSGGAAFAEIERDERTGDVKYLWPLLTKDTELCRHPDTLELYLRVNTPQGDIVNLPYYNVLHIQGTTLNGYNGKSPATLAANVIGLSLALERFASLHFKNGGFVKDYLKTAGKLSPEARQNLRDSWVGGHGSLTTAQRTAILEEGLEYVAVMAELGKVMPPEVRTQQVLEVARIYRMQPNKIGEYGRATWSNAEQMGIDHYSSTLLPWFTRWEQACAWKLRLSSEKDLFFEFLADNFLRGDYKSRMEGYATAMQSGIMTRNEVRAKENLPPVDGGDELFVPMNMAPLSKIISGEIQPSGQEPGGVKK